MAVTQINGRKAKEHILVNGIDWRLKKDATDPSTIFPFEKMNWLNAGCNLVGNGVYCCWILGVIPPAMGTLEKPVSVFTLGFNSAYIPMTPSSLTKNDMQRMHFYTSDYTDFAKEFLNDFLDVKSQTGESAHNRPVMSPFPTSPILGEDEESVELSDAIDTSTIGGPEMIGVSNQKKSSKVLDPSLSRDQLSTTNNISGKFAL